MLQKDMKGRSSRNQFQSPVSSVSIYQTEKSLQLSPFLYKTKTMRYSVCITIILIQCRSLAFYWVQMTFSKLNMGQLVFRKKGGMREKKRRGRSGACMLVAFLVYKAAQSKNSIRPWFYSVNANQVLKQGRALAKFSPPSPPPPHICAKLCVNSLSHYYLLSSCIHRSRLNSQHQIEFTEKKPTYCLKHIMALLMWPACWPADLLFSYPSSKGVYETVQLIDTRGRKDPLRL